MFQLSNMVYLIGLNAVVHTYTYMYSVIATTRFQQDNIYAELISQLLTTLTFITDTGTSNHYQSL